MAESTERSGSVSQQFDVFLSYNSRDRAVVQRIAERLKRAGIEPWLDLWSLTPGREWHRELGAGLDASVTCAVFVGSHDLGAWELQEVALAVDRAANQQGFRVFPVLLPGLDDPFGHVGRSGVTEVRGGSGVACGAGHRGLRDRRSTPIDR